MLEICVHNALYLFHAIAVLTLILYASPCIRFDSYFSRMVFAGDMAVVLKTVMETAVGTDDAHWPQDTSTNLFIIAMFACFFFVLSPQIWGTVFLVLGLIAVGPFWNPVAEQIESFFQHSLDFTIEHTHTKALVAGVIVFILTLCACGALFRLTVLQVFSLAIVFGVKATVSIKVLLIDEDKICCYADSDPAFCPFWFNKWDWVMMLGFFVFRLIWARLLRRGWLKLKSWSKDKRGNREGYEVLPDKEDSEPISHKAAPKVEIEINKPPLQL